jgi:hypothetical protein
MDLSNSTNKVMSIEPSSKIQAEDILSQLKLQGTKWTTWDSLKAYYELNSTEKMNYNEKFAEVLSSLKKGITNFEAMSYLKTKFLHTQEGIKINLLDISINRQDKILPPISVKSHRRTYEKEHNSEDDEEQQYADEYEETDTESEDITDHGNPLFIQECASVDFTSN